MREGNTSNSHISFVLLKKPKSVPIVYLNYSANIYSKTMFILIPGEAMKEMMKQSQCHRSSK